jgi:hypothetical protein
MKKYLFFFMDPKVSHNEEYFAKHTIKIGRRKRKFKF